MGLCIHKIFNISVKICQGKHTVVQCFILIKCNNYVQQIDVIRNSAEVGFPQLIRQYKQTFTVIVARCPNIHNRVTNVFDNFTIN